MRGAEQSLRDRGLRGGWLFPGWHSNTIKKQNDTCQPGIANLAAVMSKIRCVSGPVTGPECAFRWQQRLDRPGGAMPVDSTSTRRFWPFLRQHGAIHSPERARRRPPRTNAVQSCKISLRTNIKSGRPGYRETSGPEQPGCQTPDIRQRWPGGAVQIVQTKIGGDETISGVEAHGGTNERAIDFDGVRLQHGSNPFQTGYNKRDISGRCARRDIAFGPGRVAQKPV